MATNYDFSALIAQAFPSASEQQKQKAADGRSGQTAVTSDKWRKQDNATQSTPTTSLTTRTSSGYTNPNGGAIGVQRYTRDELLGYDLTARDRELEAPNATATAARNAVAQARRDKAAGRATEDDVKAARRNLAAARAAVSAVKDKYELAKRVQYEKKGDDEWKALPSAAQKQIEALYNVTTSTDAKSRLAAGVVALMGGPNQLSSMAAANRKAHDDAYAALATLGYSRQKVDQLLDYYTRRQDLEKYLAAYQDAEEMVNSGVGGTIGANLLSVGTNLASGAGQVDLTLQRIGQALSQDEWRKEAPLNYYSYGMLPYAWTQGVRQTTSGNILYDENGDERGGASKVLNSMYQAGMSMADSAAVAGMSMLGLPPEVGLTLLGGSAATSAMVDAVERGATDTQAVLTGLAAGVAEAMWESISLDSVLEIKALAKSAGKDTARRVAAQVLLNQAKTEGLEEIATDLTNAIMDQIINGDLSDFNTSYRQYLADGMTPEQAKTKAWADFAGQVALSGVMGTVTGGIMGASGLGLQGLFANHKAKTTYSGNTAALLARAEKLGIDNKDTKTLAEKKDSATGGQIRAVVEDIVRQEIADTQEAKVARIERELKEAGAKGNVKQMAAALAARLTVEQTYADRPVEQDAAESVLQESLSRSLQRRLIRSEAAKMVYLQELTYLADETATTAAEEAVAAAQTVAADTNFVGKTGTALADSVLAAARTEGVTNRMLTELVKNGGDVEAMTALGVDPAKLTTNTERRAALKQAIQARVESEKNNSTEAGTTTEAGDNTEDRTDQVLPSFNAYFDSLRAGDATITEADARESYDALAQEYTEAAEKRAAEYDKAHREDRLYLPGTGFIGYRGFRAAVQDLRKADGSSYSESQLEQAFQRGVEQSRDRWTAKQTAQRAKLDKLAERINQAFDKRGLSLKARVSYDDPVFVGEGGKSRNAYFSTADNTIVFNGRTLTSEGAVLWFLGHEVLHPASDVDSDLVSMVLDTFRTLEHNGKLTGEAHRRVANMEAELDRIQRAYQQNENQLAAQENRQASVFTREQAKEELAADLMRYAFSQSKLFEDIVEEKPSLAGRMRQAVQRLISALRGDDGRADKEVDDALQKLADRLDAALEKAGQERLAVLDVEKATAEDLSQADLALAENDSGQKLFSYSTMREDLGGYMQDLRDAGLVGEGKVMSEEELTELYNAINRLMDYAEANIEAIEPNEAYRNMTASNRPFSPYKNNSDPHYKKALDFSTLCRKRLLTQAIMEKLQAALKRSLTPVEQVRIRNEIKKLRAEGKKLDVACALCYVEAARLKTPKVINAFLSDRRKATEDFFSKNDSTFIKEVYHKRGGDWKEAHGLPRNATKAQIADKGGLTLGKQFEAFQLAVRGEYMRWLAQTDPERYNEVQEEIARAEQLDAAQFLSAASLAKLKQELPNVYKAFIDKIVSASRSKAMETDVPYVRGDINSVGQKLIDRMNEESGFRHQSWSDFQAMHLLDTIAAIIELSTRKAKVHAYTKVADLVRFLGDTGLMLNMSLIPAGDTGLDENGNLAFDPEEGIAYDVMQELRRRYHATAGNIAIGINNAQIRALLASDEIDYVIPYHISGLNADMRKRLGIRAWGDYSRYQNEKGDAWDKKAPRLREWFDEKEAMAAADGTAYMRKASEKYLALCHERGLTPKFPQFLQKNTDGSYSLAEDAQNYWKLLIDRKMVDQTSNAVIIQKPVVPRFNEQVMMDILTNEVTSQAAKDTREAVDTIVQRMLENPGNITKAERAAAKAMLEVQARVAVEATAEDMASRGASGRRFSLGSDTVPWHELIDTYGLTDNEASAILRYKSGESYTLNGRLNAKADLTDYLRQFRDDLDSALLKLPTFKGKAYRHYSFDDFGADAMLAFISQFEAGNPINLGGYLSASQVPNRGRTDSRYTVDMEIESIGARDLSAVGANAASELLFPRTTMLIPLSLEQTAPGRFVMRLKEEGAESSEGIPYDAAHAGVLSLPENDPRSAQPAAEGMSNLSPGGAAAVSDLRRDDLPGLRPNDRGRGVGSQNAAESGVDEAASGLSGQHKEAEISNAEASEESGASSATETRFSLGDGYTAYGPDAAWTEQSLDNHIHDYSYGAKRSKAYAVRMRLDDFLKLTTNDEENTTRRANIERQARENPEYGGQLDVERLSASEDRETGIFLDVNLETGRVEGHEGRHRAVLMTDAGVETAPVLITNYKHRYDEKSILPSMTLWGQRLDWSKVNPDARARNRNNVTVENLIPVSEGFREELTQAFATPADSSALRYSLTTGEDDEQLQEFIAAYEAAMGDGQAEVDYPTLNQKLRAAERAKKAAQRLLEQETAKRTRAETNLKDNQLAWQMYHKRVMRAKHNEYRAKLDEARKAKQEAVREATQRTRDVERAKAEIKLENQELAERMNAGKKAAKRLRIKEDTYGALKQENLERQKLRRNAARNTLKDQRLAERKRAEEEIKQGPVSTLRKSPQERKAAEVEQSIAQRLRTLGRRLYANFVSTSAAIERLARRQKGGTRASTLATVVGGVNGTVEALYEQGLVNRSGDRIGDAMKDVFLMTAKNGTVVDEERQALLQDYLLHVHNIDRMGFIEKARANLETFEASNPWLAEMDPKEFAKLVATTDAEAIKAGKTQARELAREYDALLQAFNEARDKAVFADENGNPVTAETSRSIVASYEAANPWLKEKAEGIYEWWDKFMRAWVVGASITEEQYDRMREMYPHYVPTYRVDKGGMGFSFANQNGATPGRLIKTATGSIREIVNVEDSFANLVQKAVKQARVNELYQNLIDTAMLDNDGTFSDMMYFDWLSYGEQHGLADEVDLDVGERIEDAEKAGLTKDGNGFRVSAWYDGELIPVYVSEELFNSLKDTVAFEHDKLDAVAKLGSRLTTPMKTAITGINPNFAVRNLMRDVPTAVINSISGLAFPVYWVRAWKEMVSRSANWQHYRALGGGSALYYNNEGGFGKALNMEDSRRGKAKRVWNKMKTGAAILNESTEAVTRFAEYLATVDKLGDTYENRLLGIKNAAEVTVDFSRRGKYGNAINAWIPYWNPAVQGIDKVFRSVFETPEGQTKLGHALRTIGRAGVTTALLEVVMQLIYAALGRRDDWEELSDRVKDTYYCIPLPGEHRFLKIPKNREWGAILGTPIMRLIEGYNGRENPFEGYIETSIIPNFLPGMPTDIVGLSQLIDLRTNKDFAGRTIVPYAYQQGSKAGQYDSDTGVFAKWVSDAIGNAISPMQFDYIIQDYFGDLGKMITMLTSRGFLSGEKSAEEVGSYVLDVVKNPWVADNRYSNQYTSRYYDTITKLQEAYNDKKNHLDGDAYKDSVEYKTYQAMEKLYGKEISDLSKSIRDETNEDVKDRVKSQIVQLAKDALEFYDDSMSGRIKDPVLTAKYYTLPGDISNELIRLDGLSGEYAFSPTTASSKSYVDPNSKQNGKATREYILDDRAVSKRNELREQYYNAEMRRVINSTAYRNASDTQKAAMLEEARETAYAGAKDEFMDWLYANYKSTPRK